MREPADLNDRKMITISKGLLFSLFGGLILPITQIEPAQALVASETVKLAPHRAIYEMRLDESRPGSGVTGILGRMVFEFAGSDCEGYTLNMRLVTQVTNSSGKPLLTDLRSSTWEKGDGRKFRFNSSQYLNDNLSEVTTGDASRLARSNKISVKLKRPKQSQLSLPANVLFPTQHSKVLLRAAQKGQSIVQARVYDGSEKGLKSYETTAVIGKTFPKGANKEFAPAENAELLDKYPSWPVEIGYFDKTFGEGFPVYQISFRLFSNGVSRKLLIDYGDFTIRGSLTSIKFLEASKCH
jgi:hypothetical protein